MKGSDVAELRAFMAIVERGNFARAAGWLGVSPSALSQTIQRLEARLGQRLLNRTTRTTRPTEAGQQLYERVRPALKEISAAQAQLLEQQDALGGRLRINASRTGAAYALAPHLASFAETYPGIEVEIVISDRLENVVASECDAGLRLGESLEQDMVGVPVSEPLRWIAVASPRYLARAGTPEHPAALKNHTCINMRWPSGGHLFHWEFEREGQSVRVAVTGPLCTNDVATRLRAVKDGLGIGYFLEPEVRSLLSAGDAVEVLEAWCPREPGFYLYYPGNRLVTPQLRAFLDHVMARREEVVAT
ncbi:MULTISPECIES: LysR family transcriptional regulator [unclassified Halomonas]|jgi:DNA-binding transcriptional LysR family regulator|uniref:LysR family transcriptional regulator n=1 Tax=unclassified Halomonas TaxID=2609666 RepID=UPI001CF3EEE6|nr:MULTISPECIES: LysR family transcriptional regulator [unclassified Halomonas]MCA8865547.1 LysR family transcriptional regulator [Halomonas sp. SBBP1]UZH10407.1 LysR substrate-binding domain-containing protein [Halomonas sp. BDJS001]